MTEINSIIDLHRNAQKSDLEELITVVNTITGEVKVYYRYAEYERDLRAHKLDNFIQVVFTVAGLANVKPVPHKVVRVLISKSDTEYVYEDYVYVESEEFTGWTKLNAKEPPSIGTGEEVLKNGAWGLGSDALGYMEDYETRSSFQAYKRGHFYHSLPWFLSTGSILNMGYANHFHTAKIAVDVVRKEIGVYGGRTDKIDESKWIRLFHDRNTTQDVNGNLRLFGSIVRLSDDGIVTVGLFTKTPEFEKLDTGVYKITNTMGLCRTSWWVSTPRDQFGVPYFVTEVEEDKETRDVIVRVYEALESFEEVEATNEEGNPIKAYRRRMIKGEPIDISTSKRWIDLGFDIPNDINPEILDLSEIK